ncbi:hypothetical protein IJH02_01590 [Candidatus Saccharibacteria bacterium]|nr:hypothetical protein [Candidatus Saccharibacteria bacterium]
MADTATTTYELKFEWLFLDGDTRVFTLKNPKSTITTEEIQAIETLIIDAPQEQTDVQTQLLVGDKAGSLFRRINTVVRETKTVTKLDVTLQQ